MLYPTPIFGTITGSQVTLSGGLHNFYINIQSGVGTVNGTMFWAPQTFQGGAVDSRMVLQFGGNINLGVTGNGRINYMYL